MRRHAPLILLLAALGAAPAAASEWSDAVAPTPGTPQVIGNTGNGCIAGAMALPADGPGFQTIRMSRRRYFGHPDTVAFVAALGRAAHRAGLADFYVGDMAQPRGGPMLESHVTHQNGLDVDIWFNLDPKPSLPPAAREDVSLPSMLLPDKSAVDPARFGAAQVTLLRLAARDSRVDRILVNPAIKRALCQGAGGAGSGDRAWLRTLRPWYGHDDHFHVRLKCPAGSPLCEDLPPPPPGEGCDPAIFAWWETELARPKVPSPPRPPLALPAACRAIAAQP